VRQALRIFIVAALLACVPSAAAHEGRLPRASLDSTLNGAVSVAEANAAAPSWVNDAWCAGDPGRTTDDTAHAVTTKQRIKVIYAYAADQPNNFAKYASQFQAGVKGMMGVVSHHSGGRKTLRFDMGTACGPGYADIQTVRLPKTLAAYRAMDGIARMNELFFVLRDRGFGKPNDYVVFFDGAYTGDSVGAAFPPGDERPGPENTANLGGDIVFTYGWGQDKFFGDLTGDYALIHVPLHEIFHGLGAVNFYAPHASSPSGHCTDEYDVLCGQSTSPPLDLGACPDGGQSNLVLDCNKDDYFNPTGPIIGTNAGRAIWNTYNSVFLCPVAGCRDPKTSGGPEPGGPPPGASPPPVPAAPPVPDAPRVTALSLRPSRFQVPKKKRRDATRIRYGLSGVAHVKFTVDQRKPGRRSGRRCVTATKRNSKRRKCTRHVRLRGALAVDGSTGGNVLGWNGRLRGRALKPGTYRLIASTAPGDRRTATFRVRR
jgi:hypothetical protein